jgi:EmrB/QacA subfamily drug resistance transporter
MSSSRTEPAASTSSGEATRIDPAIKKLAGVMIVGALAGLLDTTIVNVAIKTIGLGLHASLTDVQWVMTGYLLSFAMVIPLSGWALARFGAKLTWIASLAVFLAGSMASGAAWNIGSLIAFRVLQGIGGGLLVPLFMTILIQAAGGKSLGRLMATVSLPVVVVPILGPVVGGLIIANLSWRWIFYVNVPIVLLGMLLAWRYMPGQQRSGDPAVAGKPAPRLDVIGLALLSPAVALLLYGLANAASAGGFGRRDVLVPLAAGCVLLAVFVARNLMSSHGPRTPVIDLRLFRIRSFAGASSLMFISGLSLYGALFLLPLYYQQVRGTSVLEAGLLMAPQGIGSLLPRTLAGKLTDRLGPRPVVLVGMLMAAAATVPFALSGLHTSYLLLCLVLVVRGGGLSSANIAVAAGAFTDVPRASVPDASSATRIMQQIGGSFGTAVLAMILVGHSYQTTFWWSVGFTALAVLPAVMLPMSRGTGRAGAGQR